MVAIGVHCEGFLECPLRKLENGLVVPDVSIDELQEYHRRALRTQIDVGIVAEDYGYDFVVTPENHFDLVTQSSADPVTTQTVIATNTEQIRLLQVANSLPRHEPIRLAERTAMLDVISNGRADIGVATGSGTVEEALFEPDEDSEVLFEEYVDVLQQAWSQNAVRYEGDAYTVPPAGLEWDNDQEYFYYAQEGSGCHPEDFLRVTEGNTVLQALTVLPQPEQQPYPQMWRAAATPGGAAKAARAGMNVCTFCGNFDDVAELVSRYYKAAEESGWPDRRREYDGEPFARGWDDDRRRGIAVQVPLFDTDIGDQQTLDAWKLGQECILTSKRSGLPPEEAHKIPVDAELLIESTDAPIVGGTDEIVTQLQQLREVCDFEGFAVIPSIPVPGMKRKHRLRQFESFAVNVVPHLE